MKVRGQLKLFLLFGSITGNVLLALSLWDIERVSVAEISEPRPVVTRSWEQRLKKQALKRRIVALEKGILEARGRASILESRHLSSGQPELLVAGNAELRKETVGAESLSEEKVTRAVEALLAELQLPSYDEEDEDIVFSNAELEEPVSAENNGVLNFDDEDEFDYDRAEQKLRTKILPFLPQKEALFRGLLKGFTKSKNVDEREMVLSLFNEIREFLGTDESVHRIALEFVADSKVDPELRLELLDIIHYPESEEEGAALVALQSLVNHSSVEIRRQALRHLLDFSYPDQAGQFEALARDASEDSDIRVLGVCGLDLESRGTLDFVIGLSRGASKGLRGSAIRRLAEDESGARKELFHELIQDNKEKRDLNVLMNYLLAHGDSETVRILEGIVEREDSGSHREYFDYMRDNLKARLKEAESR
ncbi:MAG: hypothetical protein P1V97_21760 [Planctomycetota bacterium]|nr:hypothetical protein [Planctomycetota bacterium]